MAVVAFDVFEADVLEDGIFADFTSDTVDRMDITNKLIFLKTTVTEANPVDDIYKEVRTLRGVDESLRVMNNPVVTQGNEPKGGGKFTPRRMVLLNGWRIALEYQVNSFLNFTGEMISDDGLAGSQLVILDYLGAGASVLVNYEPPVAEIITVVVGGADVSEELAAAIAEIPQKVWSHTQ
jgi:hypothetical protein